MKMDGEWRYSSMHYIILSTFAPTYLKQFYGQLQLYFLIYALKVLLLPC